MMTVILWFAGLCALVALALVATARSRARPDDVIGRAPFVAVAIAHAGLAAAAVWAWGGERAVTSRGDALRAGPRVELELRAVTVPLDRAISIGHARDAAVRLPGSGAAEVARVTRDARGVVVAQACPAATFVVPPGATLPVADCNAPAFTIRADKDRIAVAPAGRPARVAVRAGEVVRLGRADEPIPALVTWELPAASAQIVAIPGDPTDCSAWPGQTRARSGGCDVAIGAFELAAIPLVVDPDAVIARGARAALAIALPVLVGCVVLACSPRSRRRAPALSHLLRIATIGSALAALVCWRLVWAYRIDVLRDFAPIGWRVADNQLAAALVAATLAGIAARRALAWAAMLAVGWLALGLGPDALTTPRVAMIALSLAAALAPRADAIAARLARVPPDVLLAAIAAAAIAARIAAPRGVLGKLALAYALVLAGHAALRELVSGTRHRARLVGALAAATLALAAYDTGVTVAIAGIGLALAMLVAGHDALYDASRADRIGVLEREHARLVAVHGAFAVVLALAAIGVAYVASDRAWLAHGADVACHAPLVAVALFAFGAVYARVHRRSWLPHAAAAAAALALWGARGAVLERATAGHGVVADRVAAVVDPGYALLHDGRRFAATASAWREAALPAQAPVASWRGEGLFGARIVDPGVVHSIETDYLPVLVARETGVGGIAQTTLLLLALVAAVGAFASVAQRHASRAHRSRWLVAVVLGALGVYQPLASLGVLPLTGISWPGLGIDSPSDLWLFVIALAWCGLAPEAGGTTDERVRATPRVIRARRIALAALATCACAGGIVVARSAAVALARVPVDDARIAAALDYASSIACPWREHDGIAVPEQLASSPRDDGTTRFDRELHAAWDADRAPLLAAVATCGGSAGRWRLARDGDICRATFRAGGPEVRLAIGKERTTCAVASDDAPAVALRGRSSAPRGPRIRVVSSALGAAADDAGELYAAGHVIRLRAGAPSAHLGTDTRAGSVDLAPGVRIDVTGKTIMLHGDAELFLEDSTGWRRVVHARDLALDRIALVVAAGAVVQVRPAADPLLADDVDRDRRTYPYGAGLPELGWVNPYDVDHSLGLDGWIHAAQNPSRGPSCGTLAPPAIERAKVCAPSSLDGVLECKVALQPELARRLAVVADQLATAPAPLTGHDVVPTRISYVAMRGDTGEILAQASRVPGRAPLAYAPVDRDAEAALRALREQHGESDRERVEWNLPIAVGSTFKPILARAAEQAFPRELHELQLTAAGHATGCKAHRGIAVDPLLGHCPPSSLAGEPTTADAHDFLAYSPNWWQAALGLVGLALPDGKMSSGDRTLSLADVASSDLASWPTSAPLAIDDAQGPIVRGHSLSLAGLRRTPLWTHVEGLLGRPLCTLGDRASCAKASDRSDVCAARALPIDAPSRDLRYLVALGPDRLDLYDGDRADQARVPVREYFQLLRGSGAHSIGSLAQLADAFSRVVYDPTGRLAASWFPAPAVGVTPTWSCADHGDRTTNVLGPGGGLCAVVREGTAKHALAGALADSRLAIYGAKTGTTDSLAEIARRPEACAAWNASHARPLALTCGKRPPDDSLFVIAFGVVTPHGTTPLTLALQLQRGGGGSAARAAPAFITAIAGYLRADR